MQLSPANRIAGSSAADSRHGPSSTDPSAATAGAAGDRPMFSLTGDDAQALPMQDEATGRTSLRTQQPDDRQGLPDTSDDPRIDLEQRADIMVPQPAPDNARPAKGQGGPGNHLSHQSTPVSSDGQTPATQPPADDPALITTRQNSSQSPTGTNQPDLPPPPGTEAIRPKAASLFTRAEPAPAGASAAPTGGIAGDPGPSPRLAHPLQASASTLVQLSEAPGTPPDTPTDTPDETFIASDEPLPDFTAPPMRELGQHTQPLRSSPELPRLIAAQLAEVIRSNPEKPIELTLNPEELGRLRMTFQTEASTLNVILQVERPETLDLMRRHIAQLAQDMHALGYDEVSFSFQQQGQDTAAGNRSAPATQPDPTDRPDAPDRPAVQDAVRIGLDQSPGIDIRI